MRLVFGEFTLDEDRRQLLRAGVPIPLEPKAYELLTLLLARRPRALSKDQIHQVLWAGTFVSESALAGLIADLRSLLGDDARRPRYIRTVHGFGYAFSGDARAVDEPANDSSEPVVRTLELGGDPFGIHLAVSPDRKTILFTGLGRRGGDLMLIENFR